MEQYVFDITIIIASLLSVFFAWSTFKKKRYNQTIFFILLLGLFLRIFSASDPYLHSWDERYHGLVAKNMVRHPLKPTLHENPVLTFDEGNWVGANVWLGKPPFTLWVISGSIAIFGDNLFALRLPSILWSLLGIWLTFLIGKKLFNEKTGVLAAFFFAINGLLIELAGGRVSSDHVEMGFVVLVELGIYLVLLNLRDKPKITIDFLIGFVTGLAFLSKFYPALIILVVWGVFSGIHYQLKTLTLLRSVGFILIGFALTITPWVSYALVNYPEEMHAILFNALIAYNETVESHQAPFYYYLNKIMVIFGELVYVVVIYTFFKLKTGSEKTNYGGLITWALLPVLVFSFAETKRFTYLLISAPAFFVLTAQFWFYLKDKFDLGKQKIITAIGMGALIILSLRYTIERTKFFQLHDEVPLLYSYIEKEQNKLTKNTIVFGTDDYIELMFHSNVYAAYRRIPNEAKIKSLEEEGFTVLILEGETFKPYSKIPLNN